MNLQRLDTAGRVVAVLGLLRDDGANGDVAAGDRTFTLQATIFETTPGPVRLRVSAAFRGSLIRAFSIPLTVNVTGATATGIAILSPANLAYLNTSPIEISGSVGDPGAQVTVNGVPATVGGGTFQLTVPLVEGTNTLTAVAPNTGGTTSTTERAGDARHHAAARHDRVASRRVTTARAITVSGTVNDIVVGTVNTQQAHGDRQRRGGAGRQPQLPGGQRAAGARRPTRFRSSGGIVPGIRRRRVVVRRACRRRPFIRLVSGNNQTAPVARWCRRRWWCAARQRWAIRSRTCRSSSGHREQRLVPDATGTPAASVAVKTNAAGQAQVTFRLGSRSGVGSNLVEATATGFDGTAAFTATGTPTGASLIIVDAGNAQTGALGEKLAFPFVAIVTDAGFNRLGGVPVTFTVKQGGGTLAGSRA